MLVDMAGSENIDQAGQSGFEAKMQVKFWDPFCPHFLRAGIEKENSFSASVEMTDSKDQPREYSIEESG